jgi:hypothetical protein
MRALSWDAGWRVAVLVLVPFGLLALLVLGLLALTWSDNVKREYLLWRWRRSYRGKAHRVLNAGRGAPQDTPGAGARSDAKPDSVAEPRRGPLRRASTRGEASEG